MHPEELCEVRRVTDAGMGQGEWEHLAWQKWESRHRLDHVGLSASVPLDANFYLTSG